MKILVYGAGNLGCLYAAKLHESGQDVRILARGERLAAIRRHGIELEDFVTGKRTTALVKAVDRLDAGDTYELILVILPRHRVGEVLPILAASRASSAVLFLGNNAAGPGELVAALGEEPVLLGFPGAAALADGPRTRYLILPRRTQPTTIGELGGSPSPRLERIKHILERAGFPASVCPNMDAWLKTHAVEICPTANALYMAAGDARRLARTRDAMLLMLRSVREGYRVLSAQGVPVTPPSHRVVQWIPEPLLLSMARRMLEDHSTAIKIGHANEARDEMRCLADELGSLAEKTSVPMPATERLSRYNDPAVEPAADGSADIPVSYASVWITMGVLAAVAILVVLLLR